LAAVVFGIVSFYTSLLCGIGLLVGFKLEADARSDEHLSTSIISKTGSAKTHQAVQTDVMCPEKVADITNEPFPEPSSDTTLGNLQDSLTTAYKSVELEDLGELEYYLYDNKNM
jgi:hypothetical protein